MSKFVSKDGLKKVLIAFKAYVDQKIDDTESVSSSAINELEMMIENLHDDVVDE